MNTTKLLRQIFTITCLLLSSFLVASCQRITVPTDTATNNILSVDISGIKDGIIPVGSSFDVTWKSDGSVPSDKNLYEFIVFTMPHTVRFNGKGFLMLPPKVKLPFGFKFAPDKMRVLFPLYLPQSKKNQGTFKIRPLVASEFSLQSAYVVVNESGNIVFSSKAKSMTFEIQEQKPVIMVQDRVAMEKPQQIFLSASKEYELRVFKNRFQVLYADTGYLILERAGTNPNFSPGSRFIGYFTRGVDKQTHINEMFSFTAIDLLDKKVIFETKNPIVVAWGKNDSFLITGFHQYGTIGFVLPFIEANNSIYDGRSCRICDAWQNSQFVIDLENALFRFRTNNPRDNYGAENVLYNLISLTDNSIKEFTDNNYTKSLQSLGFPISRDIPVKWLVEKLRISHITLESDEYYADIVKEMRDIFSYPISVVTEKQSKLISVNPLSRGRIVSLKTTEMLDFKMVDLLKRLADIDLVVQKNKQPLEQKNWIKTKDTGKESVINAINSIKTNYPVFQKFTYSKIFNSSKCEQEEETPLDIKYQYWNNKGKQLLLVQTQCDLMSANTVQVAGDLFLFASLLNHHNYDVSMMKTVPEIILNNKEVRKVIIEKEISLSDEDSVDVLLDSYLKLDYWSETDLDNEIKSFLSANNKLLLSSTQGSSIFVFDVEKNQFNAFFPNIPEAQDLQSLHLSQDGRLVVQINKGGRLYFYDIASQKRVLNGIYVDDEIVLYTDEGFYDATPEGAHYITWYYPGLKQHFNFNQFESKFKRHDIIKSILTGQKVQKPNLQLIPPPSVEMLVKHAGNDAHQATVELSATSIRPISNMRLFVDGAPVAEIPVAGKQAQKTIVLEVKRGKHWITAVAYNDLGYSSIPKSLMIDASAVKAKSGNLYMLGVGVNNYFNMPTANLDYAKQDIIAFAKTVRTNPAKQYENVFIKQLLDKQATPNNIYQVLTNIVQQVTIDDTLILDFAGHGERGKDGKFYFLTSQSSFGDFESTGLAWEKIAALLAQTKGKVIVLLDACHSGIASQETVVPNDEYVAELMKVGKAGMVVMAASKGRQFSFEDSKFGAGHGAFHYAITQALIEERQTTDVNQNGIIELNELYHSVKFKVHKLTDGKQIPWLSRNEIIGEMPVL